MLYQTQMSDNNVDITNEQREDIRKGFAVEETVATEGWKVIQEMLETRMYHSWVDPRECNSDEEFLRREYNLFYAREAAKELVTEITELVQQAHEIDDIRRGKTKSNAMKI